MELITKRFSLTLDMVRTIGAHPFEVVDGDTGNILEVRLENDGTPIDLADRYVCMVFRSCIGTALQDTDSGITLGAETGVFSIALLPGSYGPGNVSADVQVYSGASRETLITSMRFTFRCRNALLSSETMRAQATYPPLVTATKNANDAAAEAREAAKSITTVVGPQGEKGEKGDTGEKGEKGDPACVDGVLPDADGTISLSAVRYAPQTLTDAEKVQARENISAAPTSAPINAQTASYMLTLSDAGKLVTVDAAADCTVTVPALDFPIGTEIEIAQLGEGIVTIVGDNVTIRSMDGMTALSGQYAVACLKKLDASAWLLGGALA